LNKDTASSPSFASPLADITYLHCKKASQILDANLIDVLITDLEMPGISGLQLLRCAKWRNAWTQVIVVTGHSEMEALTTAMDLGASDYPTKPLELKELENCLCEASARFRRWRHSLQQTLTQVHS
jgi:YesN/AraC family two-component response regulator